MRRPLAAPGQFKDFPGGRPEPYRGRIWIRLAIGGSGATVNGIERDIEPGLGASRMNQQGESLATTDLSDAHPSVQVAEPVLRHFGGRKRFSGRITTVLCLEDNSRVREAVGEAGDGRVLIVDGGGSLQCALLGDLLGDKAVANGWSGIVINGCARDTYRLGQLDLGVMALAPHPRRSEKRGHGDRDVPVRFAGVTFRPGDYAYADEDGLIASGTALALPA
jgi:regulator of ribonuclease activity A